MFHQKNQQRDDSSASEAAKPAIKDQTIQTILIADDDASLVQVLAMRCKRLGLNVVRSPDAMHALLGVHRTKPDLVVLDINMPGGNGLATCGMIVSDESLANTPVVIMSGKSDETMVQRCNALGVNYVQKGPRLWENLQDLICQLLNVAPLTEPSTGANVTGLKDYARNVPPQCKPKVAIKGQSAEFPGYEAATEHEAIQTHARPTVLCIDDDPDITQVIKLRLEPYGVDVIRAFSGMQGFWTAVDMGPQAIICDMNMPDGEGSYVNGRLKDHPITKDIPVIILTGLTNPALKRQMLSMGASAYLQKPLVFDELLEALEKHLPLKENAPKTDSQARSARCVPNQN